MIENILWAEGYPYITRDPEKVCWKIWCTVLMGEVFNASPWHNDDECFQYWNIYGASAHIIMLTHSIEFHYSLKTQERCGWRGGGCIMIAERCLQTCWFINLWIADQLQYTITKKNWFQCLKKNCLGTGSLKWSCLDSKSKQHTKRFKLMKSELQDQALLGSVNLPNSEVNYKNVS